MSKQTLTLIIILFFFTGGLLILALNKSSYTPKDLSLPIRSVIPVTAQTSLLFGNLEIASSSNIPKTYLLPIIINTGTNKVTSVQMELSFDPNVLTNVTIMPSTFFKNPNIIINKINNDIGKISYAIGNAHPEKGEQGEGTLAALTFESRISSVSSIITFLPKTFVAAEGLESSALKSTNSAKLTY